nr:MAG TPA: hypothetical protein [Bacteriophage sp.]
MRLKPVVKASEFMRFGFKPCRGLPKSAESYYLCVKNGHRVMFVDSKHFTESEWPIKDARIHKNPNCKFSDKRTATEIECELVVNGLLEEVKNKEQTNACCGCFGAANGDCDECAKDRSNKDEE